MDDKPVTFSSPVIPDCTAGDTTAIELVEKHHRFFFEDGNLIFTVEGILYCVHRYYFVRDSPYFASRLPAPDARTGSTTFDPTDEIWRGITGADIDAFLSILFPLNFDSCDICSVEAWASVLHLSTKWGFASIRRLALRNLVPITDALPVERLRLAREYAVEEWILPALTALCTRPTCPTLEEARRMVDADVVVVYTVREAILTSNIPDDDTEIAYQIRLWIKLNSASTPEPVHGSEGRRTPDAAVSEEKKDTPPSKPKHEELSRSPDETGNVKETALSVRTISGAAAPVQIGSTTTSTSPPTHQHSPLSPPSHSSHPIPSEHHAPVSKETKETKEDEESEEDEWVLPAKKVKGLSSSVQSSVGKKKKRSDEIWTSEK